MGAVIVPPMLTYYDHPASPADCTHHTADRILAQFGLDGAGINGVLALTDELLAETLRHLAI